MLRTQRHGDQDVEGESKNNLTLSLNLTFDLVCQASVEGGFGLTLS